MKRAFTLVELLIVVAIIGILAGAVLFSLQDPADKAKKGVIKAELSRVPAAVAGYFSEHENYTNVCRNFIEETVSNEDLSPIQNIGRKYVTDTPDAFGAYCRSGKDDWGVAIVEQDHDAEGTLDAKMTAWCISAADPNAREGRIEVKGSHREGQEIAAGILKVDAATGKITCLSLGVDDDSATEITGPDLSSTHGSGFQIH